MYLSAILSKPSMDAALSKAHPKLNGFFGCRIQLYQFISFFGLLISAQIHAETLCSSKEVVYYSCEITNTQKLVSLCGNDLDDPDGFWLQYRFGRLKRLELVYPDNRDKSKHLFIDSGFDVSHLRRSGGWDSEVSFTTNGWSYTIISWIAGEGETTGTEGIFVAKDRSGHGTTLKCSSSANFVKEEAFSSLVQQYNTEH